LYLKGEPKMAKDITIYTTTTCPSCNMVKTYLKAKGHTYNEVNVDTQPDLRQTAIDVSGGAMTTPVTVIRDSEAGTQDVTVGWNAGKLAAALAA
jgi:glutaredoxin 3